MEQHGDRLCNGNVRRNHRLGVVYGNQSTCAVHKSSLHESGVGAAAQAKDATARKKKKPLQRIATQNNHQIILRAYDSTERQGKQDGKKQTDY